MWALIFNDKVWQIENEPFPVAPLMEWVETQDNNVSVGDYFINGEFQPAPVTAAPVIPDSVFQLATKKMIKAMMLFNKSLVQYINGTITKPELNTFALEFDAKYDEIKDYLKEITSGD